MADRPCTYRRPVVTLGTSFDSRSLPREPKQAALRLGQWRHRRGGEFVLKFALPDTDLAVFFVFFFFCGLLSFLVCYIVRQQSQSILCGSVLTTMTTMTTMRLVQAQSWQSWQSKSRRTVRSATAKRKNNLGPQGGFVRNPWTPPPTGLAFTEDVISWCTL